MTGIRKLTFFALCMTTLLFEGTPSWANSPEQERKMTDRNGEVLCILPSGPSEQDASYPHGAVAKEILDGIRKHLVDRKEMGDIRTSLDLTLQTIMEEELLAAAKQYQPQRIIGILINPKTGELLALASRQSLESDAGKPSGSVAAISYLYEPESALSIVTAAAALNEGILHKESKIERGNGIYQHDGMTFREVPKKRGELLRALTVEEIIATSSSIGRVKLGIAVGEAKYDEYLKRFGFGQRTGIAISGEVPGIIQLPANRSKNTFLRMVKGEQLGVTPLQMAFGYAAIANGGWLVQPKILLDSKESINTNRQRIISADVADVLRQGLIKAVSQEGTGRLAQVQGIAVAGKTSTVAKIVPGQDRNPYDWVVSFTGFLPADNPELLCVILVDSAQVESSYGGTVAAPIFSKVMQRAAAHQGL